MRHLSGRARSRSRAQGMPMFVGALLVIALGFGLIQDGMLLFAGHRRAVLLAESAARAGAGALDQESVRLLADRGPRLDPKRAEMTARAYVLQQQPDAAVDASANGETIIVTVRLRVPPTLLHPPGEPTVEVVAEGIAHPFVGLATSPS
jgi:hypothetical protein